MYLCCSGESLRSASSAKRVRLIRLAHQRHPGSGITGRTTENTSLISPDTTSTSSFSVCYLHTRTEVSTDTSALKTSLDCWLSAAKIKKSLSSELVSP